MATDYSNGNLAFYAGGEASGVNLVDDGSSSYTLTDNNSVPNAADAPSGLVSSDSQDYNGTNDYHDRTVASGIADFRWDGSADRCGAIWLKADALSTSSSASTIKSIAGRHTTTGNQRCWYLHSYNNNWRLYVDRLGDNSQNTTVDTSTGHSTGSWVLLIWYYQASDGEIGISANGAFPFTTATHTSQIIFDSSSAPFCLATYNAGGGRWWNGHMASFWMGSIIPDSTWVADTWNSGNGTDMTPTAGSPSIVVLRRRRAVMAWRKAGGIYRPNKTLVGIDGRPLRRAA